MYIQRGELNRETVYPMHPSSIHGVEDMSTLAELHEAAIMHNLFLRYKKDSIYVRVWDYKLVLIARDSEAWSISALAELFSDWTHNFGLVGGLW